MIKMNSIISPISFYCLNMTCTVFLLDISELEHRLSYNSKETYTHSSSKIEVCFSPTLDWRQAVV